MSNQFSTLTHGSAIATLLVKTGSFFFSFSFDYIRVAPTRHALIAKQRLRGPRAIICHHVEKSQVNRDEWSTRGLSPWHTSLPDFQSLSHVSNTCLTASSPVFYCAGSQILSLSLRHKQEVDANAKQLEIKPIALHLSLSLALSVIFF